MLYLFLLQSSEISIYERFTYIIKHFFFFFFFSSAFMTQQHKSKMPSNTLPCSIPSLFLFLCIVSISIFFFFFNSNTPTSSNSHYTLPPLHPHIKVFLFDLPRSLNYGILDKYWSLETDTRIGSEVDNDIRKQKTNHGLVGDSVLYPQNPIIKQYSAEYWIMGDLLSDERVRSEGFSRRVFSVEEADVVFVPFFATASAELQLVVDKGVFRKKVEENEDYVRQRMVVDLVKKSEGWRRSGGRDHVFVLTGMMLMIIAKFSSDVCFC